MSRIGIKDRLQQKSKALFDAIYNDYRPILDSRITVLDLSYEALKINVYRGGSLSDKERLVYDRVYNTLSTVVKQSLVKRTYPTLEDPRLVEYFSEKNKQQYPILIDNGVNDFFIVGKNFDSIRNFVTNNISKDSRLKATRFGESTTYTDILNKKGLPSGDQKITVRSKVDIGHIPASESENLSSPLELKLQEVLNVAIQTGNNRVQQAANKALKELYDIQAEVSYNFKNVAPEAIERAQKVLGKGYVVVTLHTSKKNNEFSRKEKQLYDRLVAETVLSLGIEHASGSNTIVEDIEESIVNILSGKKPPKPHQEQNGKIIAKRTRNIKTSSARIITPKRSKVVENNTVTPISSLLLLINTKLGLQIKQNMGTGSSRSILNYRTGRFSESAKVERLSESKNGLISAFYSYMRNPYGTFSVGGKQEIPKSRDPKLLISKSIREIASAVVGNRMRAVLV